MESEDVLELLGYFVLDRVKFGAHCVFERLAFLGFCVVGFVAIDASLVSNGVCALFFYFLDCLLDLFLLNNSGFLNYYWGILRVLHDWNGCLVLLILYVVLFALQLLRLDPLFCLKRVDKLLANREI